MHVVRSKQEWVLAAEVAQNLSGAIGMCVAPASAPPSTVTLSLASSSWRPVSHATWRPQMYFQSTVPAVTSMTLEMKAGRRSA